MPIIKGMQKNKSRTKVARRTDGSVKKVCTKCQKCGTPRQGHFDKKSRQEKIKLMAERPIKFPIATYQIAAVCIQKHARAFIVRNCRRNFLSAEWQPKVCVHYLTKRGPYGRSSCLSGQHRMPVHERVAVVEIQQLWRNYSCRKFIRSLGVNADKSSVIIQSKFWRAEICRRYYLIIRDAVKNQSEDGRRDNLLVQLIDAKCIESLSYQPDWNKMLTFRIDSTTWPPLLVYKSLDNKVLVDFDGGDKQRSDVHVNHPKFNFTTEIMEEMRQAL